MSGRVAKGRVSKGWNGDNGWNGSGRSFESAAGGRYMVKTIGADEKRQLEKMLPDYYVHLKQNPHSLLARFTLFISW